MVLRRLESLTGLLSIIYELKTQIGHREEFQSWRSERSDDGPPLFVFKSELDSLQLRKDRVWWQWQWMVFRGIGQIWFAAKAKLFDPREC